MGIFGCLIVGIVVGVVGRAIQRRPQSGGLIGTVVAGSVGAVVGATIAPAIGVGELRTFFSLGAWATALALASGFLAAYLLIIGYDDHTGHNPHGVRG